jgi:SAM-dependent methyltransferase
MSSASRTTPFVQHHQRYEDWFGRHRVAYLSELLAVRALLPWQGRGLEIGVGSGCFAAPLGIEFGIDPAAEMLNHARVRGVKVACAVAEALPFADAIFDYALIVTTICFVDAPDKMMSEVHRVLHSGGKLVIGFIDRESELGQTYLDHRVESVFYREAVFYSAAEVGELLRAGGFVAQAWSQTLFRPLAEIAEIEPVRPGTGKGAFVAVTADRIAHDCARPGRPKSTPSTGAAR